MQAELIDELLDLPLPVALTRLWPPLGVYCPILSSLSDQQLEFLMDDGRESLYGGAVGGGKSAALLMGALQYVDMPGYSALLLRRTFAELSKAGGLIPLSLEWLGGTDAKWSATNKTWTFPSGATIEFGHVQNEADMTNYQGASYTYVGFDELTHFSERIYDYIGFSRQRRKAELDVPIRTRSSANPGGIGHLWVKQRFIDDRTRNQDALFVPAKVEDNPAWTPGEYEESLAHLPEELRRQLMDGDWGAFENAAFHVGPEHLVDGFRLEDAHDRFEACDYGLNGAPWALVAVDYEGNLVFCDMLYERDLLPSDLAERVLAKRKASWGVRHRAWADPSIWHRTGARNRWGQPAMLVDEFTDHGVQLFAANNDPRAGLIRLRELLGDSGRSFPSWHPRAGECGCPGVFFTPQVARLVEELQSAPLQPLDKADGGEKVDPDWESQHGHAVAMARYAVMTRPGASTRPDPWAGVPGPLRDWTVDADEMRRELLVKVERQRRRPQRSRLIDV